jgi:hypothetical protein
LQRAQEEEGTHGSLNVDAAEGLPPPIILLCMTSSSWSPFFLVELMCVEHSFLVGFLTSSHLIGMNHQKVPQRLYPIDTNSSVHVRPVVIFHKRFLQKTPLNAQQHTKKKIGKCVTNNHGVLLLLSGRRATSSADVVYYF